MNRSKGTLSLSLLLTLVGCGKGSGSGGDPTPAPSKSQFVYVLNTADDTISQLALNSSGQLTPLAVKTVPTGQFPRAMVSGKNQSTLYVANMADDTISQFATGTDGELKPIAAPIAAGTSPYNLTLSPDGRFVYSMNIAGSIGQYTVATNGELSLTATTVHDDMPVSMVFAPSGHYSYVVNAASTDISQFSVGNDGSLLPLTPATVPSRGCPSGPVSANKNADGSETIYVLSCATSEIEIYAVGNDGTLTSQQVVTTGFLPAGMQISGSNIYVANAGSASVSMFSIQANGNLQALAQPTIAAGMMPETLAADADGKYVYVLDLGLEQIIKFSVAFDGQLVPSQEAPISSGGYPTQIIVR
jgi:6-phosphogluconolactonase (cycloisomerase 2 family)